MPQNSTPPGSAADWLARAKSDLAIAQAPLPEGALLEDLCYHAQQSAEKALKAVYQHHGWTFRYTHDLETLMSGLKDQGLGIPDEVLESDTLSRYAWEARYPGLEEAIDLDEYNWAVDMARTVLNWAASCVG